MSIFASRWHIITGKGGVGKTVTAAALATALTLRGQRVLLVEVEQRSALGTLLGIDAVGYTEVAIPKLSLNGGELFAIEIDPDRALLEYLDRYYAIGRAARVLRRVGAVDFVTGIAPGLRDLLVLGKTADLVESRTREHFTYDSVVLDAPPTGRIGKFLNVADEIADLMKLGRIKKQSDDIGALLRSKTTAVHLVTLLEHLPVKETQEAAAELVKLGIPIGVLFINGVINEELRDMEITWQQLQRGLKAGGLSDDPSLAKSLLGEFKELQHRLLYQNELRSLLGELGHQMVELPYLAEEITFEQIKYLATTLQRHMAV